MTATHQVTGAAVVLRLSGGGERYLYRGTRLSASSFDAQSVEHAVAVGLLHPVSDEPAAGKKTEGRSARS